MSAPIGQQAACRLQIGHGPFMVHADAAQLAMALEQLVENAVEAMPDGGRLELTVALEDLMAPLETPLISVPPGHYVTLSVCDTGVGIPATSLAVVCDPFHSTKPPPGSWARAGIGARLRGVTLWRTAHRQYVGGGHRMIIYLPAR